MNSTASKTGRIVAVAAFAAFLATFNETFLNVAFTPVMNDFGIKISTVQWLATAYMIGAAIMIPVSAFLYKSIPTRRLFLITVALLIVGSVAGAMASSFPMLLIGRIIQSLGTGMLIPIGMNIALAVAPKEKLGTCMGIMGAMTTLGPSTSVIVAGVLLSYFDWQMLLWVFATLSTACFLFGAIFLRNIAKLTNPKLDAISVMLIGIALTGILYGISTIFNQSLLSAQLSLLVGVIALFLFIARQKNLVQPLIDLRPLFVKPFVTGVILNMLALIIIFAMNIIIPVFMQSVLGASSFRASITLFPAILLSCIVAPVAGKQYDRHGERTLLLLGFALICVFVSALSFFITKGSLLSATVAYIPVICGSALIIGPIQSYALSHLTAELNPHGVTIMSSGFQIAGCIGSSVFSGIYAAAFSLKTSAGVTSNTASSFGFILVGLLASILALLGFLISFFMKKSGNKKHTKVPSPALSQLMERDVFTISVRASLMDALKLVVEKKISGVPVVNAGNLVGFISDGDIFRYLAKIHPLYVNQYSFAACNKNDQIFHKSLQHLIDAKVADIAEKSVITVNADTDLAEVCRILSEHHLKKVPVMEKGKIIGMINRSSIRKYAVHWAIQRLTDQTGC